VNCPQADPCGVVGERISPLENLDRALLEILDRVREHTRAGRAVLFLRDPSTGELVTRVGHDEALVEVRLPAGEGLVGAVFRENRALRWPGRAPEPHPRAVAATGVRPGRILGVPVAIDSQLVGVLELVDGAIDLDIARRCAEGNAARIGKVLAASSLAAQLLPKGERSAGLHFLFEGVVGASPGMRRALDLAARVAPTRASVLITGETGTGKDLLARAIHANSPRSTHRLVKVDCGSIPDSLVESELFGHQRGAFTGAVCHREGVFERADGGTVFLDEVGELSAMAQTRLLRVLEERVVQRVGSAEPQQVDFRLIAATHRDLATAVQAGTFRADLLHRLQVVVIRLPSLRERGRADVHRLLEHFAHYHAARHERVLRTIPATTQDLLAGYSWPGNVRELSHAVESAVVLSPDGHLTPELFHVREPTGCEDGPFDDLPTLAELEGRYLRWLLERYSGHRTEVARVAGIGRSTLWRRLRDGDLVSDDAA